VFEPRPSFASFEPERRAIIIAAMAGPDVFISYSHREDQEWIAKFRERLEREVNRRARKKKTFWRDPQLLPGEDWRETIIQAAGSATVFVAIVSPGWLDSEVCQEELSAFRGSGVVSILTLDVRDRLPEELRRYQWEQFFATDERGVDRTFVASEDGAFPQAIGSVAVGIVRLLGLPPRRVLDPLLYSARRHAYSMIRERCGTLKILDMERPIDSQAIYTRVNILERLTARQRKSLAELKAEFRLDLFERFGIAASAQARLDAEDVIAKTRRLVILGKPGAGKTTLLKRLAIRCSEGHFRPDLVPAYVELRSINDSTIKTKILALWAPNHGRLSKLGVHCSCWMDSTRSQRHISNQSDFRSARFWSGRDHPWCWSHPE
jgi:hypothetical protein